MTNSDSVIPPGSKVLVTGANGYIAIWLVAMLLEKGYSVRGTVRSERNVGEGGSRKTCGRYWMQES